MTAHTVWTAIKNSLRAIRNGEFLLRVRADKLYMHILGYGPTNCICTSCICSC